jgi:hypothetical protein
MYRYKGSKAAKTGTMDNYYVNVTEYLWRCLSYLGYTASNEFVKWSGLWPGRNLDEGGVDILEYTTRIQYSLANLRKTTQISRQDSRCSV